LQAWKDSINMSRAAAVAASIAPPHTAPRMRMHGSRETDTDEAMMLAWQAGTVQAFDQLYERHRGGVFRYLLRHCRDRGRAEELHHDVWLKIIAARDGWQPTARFTTWLYTVARNRLIDHWRSTSPRRIEALDEEAHFAPEGFEPSTAALATQLGVRIVEALDSLPEAQRDAFLLHVEGGLALADIARLSGAPTETVKSRLRYAYARLRTSLGDLR
jgi:RNA polymerase sigma-70 factor (ECF subfamily)